MFIMRLVARVIRACCIVPTLSEEPAIHMTADEDFVDNSPIS